MAEFRMPSLGADMTEGTVTRWLVGPGSTVARGDVVAEIETDKADMEVEVFQSGTIERIVVPEGELAPVGAVLAIIATDATSVAEPAPPAPPAVVEAPTAVVPIEHREATPKPRATATAKVLAKQIGLELAGISGTGIGGAVTRGDVERAGRAQAPPVASTRRLLVSPYARRMAEASGVDVSEIQGSGPGGAINSADVRRAASSGGPPATPPAQTSPPPAVRTGVRRGPIAALMEKSNAEIPHYYLALEIDLSRALAWLEKENLQRPITERVLYSALLIKAVALAAHDIPEVNGYWRDGEFEPAGDVNVGVAISLRAGGVIAPAIADAANKPLVQVMAELRGLVARSRAGRLRPTELTTGTITVTNLGELGADVVYGIIYPPQVALVGFGRVRQVPWADGGMLGVRPVVSATLAGDHRASDGHRGGLFLNAINHLLQEPEQL